MKCAKCGAHVPDNYTTCPVCGIKREFVSGPPRKPYVKVIILSIVGLALIGLLAVLFAMLTRGSGTVTSAPAVTPPPGDSVVAAPPPAPPPDQSVVSAPPAAPPAPDTTVPYAGKPKPSQAIIDYLEFVKQVEQHRKQLLVDTSQAYAVAVTSKSMQGLSGLMSMLDDENPTQANQTVDLTSQELTRQYTNWIATLKYFDGRTPPQECAFFGQYYRNVLYTEISAMYAIIGVLNSANMNDQKDITKAVAQLQEMMKGGTQANIDNAVDQAEASLDQLVANYDMVKPFSVTKEQPSGNVIGF